MREDPQDTGLDIAVSFDNDYYPASTLNVHENFLDGWAR